MMKSKVFKTMLVLTLSLLLISMYGLVFASNGKTPINQPEPKKIADTNKNKLFDNLEEKIAKATDSDEIPVIIMFNKKLSDTEFESIKNIAGNPKIKHKFETIPGIATSLTKKQIEALAKSDLVKQIEYDEPVYATMSTASYWFGVNKSRTDWGVDGDRDGNPTSYSTTDIVVAVIDTGIDTSHVDLDGGKVIAWKDYVNNRTSPYDDNGHGTHVAGIIAGTGEGNPNYKGVAPGAALIGLKVLDSTGSGSMSNVTAAVDWCIQNKSTYNIRVINMSLGTSGSSDGSDSTSVAVNNAVNNGIVVVVAAGNSGPAKYTIGSPGAAENAITVGAMADVGENGFNQAYFSSRGPTADGRTKPDVSAPGYNITAPKANSINQYVTYSGTSMATPFTSGTVALMLDANPNLTPTQIKNIIANTSKDWGPTGKDIDYGYGRLDSYEAVKSAGSYSGTNITVPNHLYGSGSLSGTGYYRDWYFDVTDTSYPIAITFIMTNWSGGSPDFDIYLYSPSGTQIAKSEGVTRQETITYTPTTTGTYRLRVYSYSGSGPYFFDISAGASNLR